MEIGDEVVVGLCVCITLHLRYSCWKERRESNQEEFFVSTVL